jgi:5-methyltetrahydropteroyltriglutamate--homocysteine methyltransferase
MIYDRDAKVFPDWFERAQAAGGPRFSYVLRGAAALKGRPEPAIEGSRCVGPLKYIGQADLKRDIENLKAAGAGVSVEELCMTALAPPIMTSFLQNEYYATEEQFLFAIAESMNEEYRTIANSGILLQLDEPSVATHWHMLTDMSVGEYRKWLELRVEVLNVALKGVPEDRVRMHTCWGSVHHPHTADIPLEDILDLILKVNVGGYSWEASNPRHDHEWQVWKDIRLPDGKVLIPGVIGHFTDWVEHPRLIAERITKYASVVGRENMVAGVDCGLGTRVGSESILWAKLNALAEGARIASADLWP